jgi:competence protein ComFC
MLCEKVVNSLKKHILGVSHLVYPEYCAVCKEVLPDGMNQICVPCLEKFLYTYYESYKEASSLDELFYGRVQLESTFSLLYFKKGSSTQELVHEIKYLNNQSLAKLTGRKMGEKLRVKWDNDFPDALIPVPLHPKKLHLRGYNQSSLIAQGVFDELKIPVHEKIIQRNTNTATQTKKGKFERWDNVETIFEIYQTEKWKNKHLCIVDDVITTGSTIEACVRALQQAIEGVRVSVISLAIAKK